MQKVFRILVSLADEIEYIYQRNQKELTKKLLLGCYPQKRCQVVLKEENKSNNKHLSGFSQNQNFWNILFQSKMVCFWHPSRSDIKIDLILEFAMLEHFLKFFEKKVADA